MCGKIKANAAKLRLLHGQSLVITCFLFINNRYFQSGLQQLYNSVEANQIAVLVVVQFLKKKKHMTNKYLN